MATQFKPLQIVCLEHQNNRLYGEVVQVIPKRELCWVRPLILAKFDWGRELFPDQMMEKTDVVDVRLTSDLIFPLKLFRPAWDLEVIPILSHLEKFDLTLEEIQLAKYHLHDFIKQIWSTNSNLKDLSID